MIDNKEGRRDSRPQVGARLPDRHDMDVFAAFPTREAPAVNVVVKRRRGTALPEGNRVGGRAAGVPRGDAPHEERRPRVYQVQTSALAPDVDEPARSAGELEPGEPVPAHVVSALPARRRRARRDPAHAPGKVTRIVFEATPPEPRAEAVAGAEAGRAGWAGFIEDAEVGYERVMAELQQLSAQLDQALSARRFRIG